MSNDKKGVHISQDEEAIHILAENNFSESATYSKEILDTLNQKEDKRLRIALSPKSKFFSDALFKIRKTIIESGWPDAAIRIHTKLAFKQTVNVYGDRTIKTPSYIASFTNDELKIWMTSQRTIYPNDEYAKEMALLIGTDKPRFLDVFFIKSHQEKRPEFQKRIDGMQRFFVRYLQDIYSIESAAFFIKSENNMIACYSRYPDSKQLIKEDLTQENPVLPVTKTKHIDTQPDNDNQNEKE